MEYVIDREKVRKVMETHGIKTQAELAERMGVTKNQVSVLLSSRSTPIKSCYQKLFDILEIDPSTVIRPREEHRTKRAVSRKKW